VQVHGVASTARQTPWDLQSSALTANFAGRAPAEAFSGDGLRHDEIGSHLQVYARILFPTPSVFQESLAVFR